MNRKLMTILAASAVICSSAALANNTGTNKKFSIDLVYPGYTFAKSSQGKLSDDNRVINFPQEFQTTRTVYLKKESAEKTCYYSMNLLTTDPKDTTFLPKVAYPTNPINCGKNLTITYNPNIYNPGGVGNKVVKIDSVK